MSDENLEKIQEMQVIINSLLNAPNLDWCLFFSVPHRLLMPCPPRVRVQAFLIRHISSIASVNQNKCSDRSMEVKLSALLGIYDRQTNRENGS